MDQKNRLLREAFELLTQIAAGTVRPLASLVENQRVVLLRGRIAKNLKITPEAKV